VPVLLEEKRGYQTKLITQAFSVFKSLEINFEALYQILRATSLKLVSSEVKRNRIHLQGKKKKNSLLLERTKIMKRWKMCTKDVSFFSQKSDKLKG
jgi:hypothetical protein